MVAKTNAAHTPAYKIFHYPFRIWIPQLYLTSIEENQALGTYTSGNQQVDREASRQKLAITSTIASMVDFYRRGITIEFHSTADCVRIYEIIVQHIESFKDHIASTVFQPADIPWEDLKAMDEFAGEVFLKARGLIAKREESSLALQSLESECAALVTLHEAPEEVIFQEIAQSAHRHEVTELESSFQRRYKSWR